MSTFSKVKEFLSSYEIGDIISRKDLMLKKLSGGSYTVDAYRLHFTKAGYLEHISRGKYKYNKKIPSTISSRELRKEAYPHYKNWHEYRHLNKDNSKTTSNKWYIGDD